MSSRISRSRARGVPARRGAGGYADFRVQSAGPAVVEVDRGRVEVAGSRAARREHRARALRRRAPRPGSSTSRRRRRARPPAPRRARADAAPAGGAARARGARRRHRRGARSSSARARVAGRRVRAASDAPLAFAGLRGDLAFSQNRVLFDGLEAARERRPRAARGRGGARRRSRPSRLRVEAQLDEVPVAVARLPPRDALRPHRGGRHAGGHDRHRPAPRRAGPLHRGRGPRAAACSSCKRRAGGAAARLRPRGGVAPLRRPARRRRRRPRGERPRARRALGRADAHRARSRRRASSATLVDGGGQPRDLPRERVPAHPRASSTSPTGTGSRSRSTSTASRRCATTRSSCTCSGRSTRPAAHAHERAARSRSRTSSRSSRSASRGATRRRAPGVGGVATAAAAQALFSASGLDEQVKRFLPRERRSCAISPSGSRARYSEGDRARWSRAPSSSRGSCATGCGSATRRRSPARAGRRRRRSSASASTPRSSTSGTTTTPTSPTGDHGVDLKLRWEWTDR